jgi:hypothetical protein
MFDGVIPDPAALRAEPKERALPYVPPNTREELFALVHRWFADLDAGQTTGLAATGEAMVREAHKRLGLRELDRICAELNTGISVRRGVALNALRKLVGSA